MISIKTRSLYVLASCGGGYAALHGAGWVLLEMWTPWLGDVLGDNSWSDSAMGECGNPGVGGWGGVLLQRAKLKELLVVWMGYILVGLPFLVQGNGHLYFYYYTLAGYIGICPYVRSFVRVPMASPLYRHHFVTDCRKTSHTCSRTSSLLRVRTWVWQVTCSPP